MKIKINYEPINKRHINQAVDLVLSAYNEERKAIPFLPDEHDFSTDLQSYVEYLFNKGTGIAAVYNNELIGFLAAFKVDELFGKCKGIYSPLYGHGVKKEYRSSLYKELYRHAADMWVKESYMNHAITLYTHDRETIDTWFWLGFGLRCVDAVREVAPINVENENIIIYKAKEEDIHHIASITGKTNEHLNLSPMFMPRVNKDIEKKLSKWFHNENHHMWVACRDNMPVGYMKIEPDGESFISEHTNIMHIKGAYVADSERNSGVGGMLLGEIQQWLMKNGYPLCGVDFESFNIEGSHFWTKYFTPYTYSMVRRIDERINEI
ncbi:GNAT family N-acetyltransferase [Oceanirhabdus sp. W0125-5]|uniref:GNAT family N-acetyltransferase n=1 Tax=Oceanirhabdus sp. W0125-5 TaxID=2999116 RepID=UPI0022F32633|nr:GNAT family N-acetyltransferase [Oceanirhabdus sp. W0125-5]WBW97120.1 GNAT family N-acetyltransferase [Oceanirhabdus sp. W0125-5]